MEPLGTLTITYFCLRIIKGDEQPDSLVMDSCPFWISLYNLPLDSRTNEDVKLIARKLGAVMEVEEDMLGWDKSRRVRVLLNVTNPLRRIQKIRDRRGMVRIVDIKYERLPLFCFACGVIGHGEKDCVETLEEDRGGEQEWGMWLCASPRRGRALMRKEVEEVVSCRKELLFTTKPKHLGCRSERGESVQGSKEDGMACSLTKNNTLNISNHEVYGSHVDAVKWGSREEDAMQGNRQRCSVEELELDVGSEHGVNVVSSEEGTNDGKMLPHKWQRIKRVGDLNKGEVKEAVSGGKRSREEDMEIDELCEAKKKVLVTWSNSSEKAEVGGNQPRLSK